MTGPLRLVVLGDSFAFTDDRGPRLPGEPTLFPNVIARCLEAELGRTVHTATVARAGWGVRQVWRTLTKDRHVQFEVLADADAVALAVGSYDHLPAGVPPLLEAVTSYLHPAGLRRGYRRTLAAVSPRLIRVTGGRFRRVPAREFVRLYDLVLGQIRGLTHGAPTVALGPTGQDADRYAGLNPHLADGEAMQERVAHQHGVAFLPIRDLVRPYRSGRNPDGIHWPAGAHTAVGEAAGRELAGQLAGSRPAPPDPWRDTDRRC